jgi:hypothetical protein
MVISSMETKQHGEVIRGGGKQHANQGKDNQGIIFADTRRNAVGKFRREKQDENGRTKEKRLKNNAIGSSTKEPLKAKCRNRCKGRPAQADEQQSGEGRNGQIGEETLALRHTKKSASMSTMPSAMTQISSVIEDEFINFGFQFSDWRRSASARYFAHPAADR